MEMEEDKLIIILQHLGPIDDVLLEKQNTQ